MEIAQNVNALISAGCYNVIHNFSTDLLYICSVLSKTASIGHHNYDLLVSSANKMVTLNTGINQTTITNAFLDDAQLKYVFRAQICSFIKDNRSLVSFRLDGTPPTPRGFPQIEMRFDICGQLKL